MRLVNNCGSQKQQRKISIKDIASENGKYIYKTFLSIPQRNHYLMLPWVVLGIMICVGLLISVIYTAVVFFIDGFVMAGVLWLVIGIVAVGKTFSHNTNLW